MADQGTEADHGDTNAGMRSPSAPQSLAAPVDAATSKTGTIGDDIAAILKGVKLPERHDTSLPTKNSIENKAAVFDTTLGAESAEQKNSPAPEIASTSSPAPIITPPRTEGTPSSVVSVHTLKDDLQQVVHEQKISVVRAASLEQDRQGRDRSPDFSTAPARPKRTLKILIAVAVLLLLGGAALFGVYTVMQSSTATQPLPASTASILFAESSVQFPLANQSSDDLKRSLFSARTSVQGALGSVTQIIPTIATTNADGTSGTRPATLAEFMQAIGAHPPDALLRALGSNFFFGIHTVDTNAPIFVIPVTSYDHAFAGMLAWESTINADLAPIFTAVPAITKDANGLPMNRTFADAVMRNYDVRVLEDDSGQIRLYYSFPTQNILIIAESPYSFAEVLSRLQAGRQL